MLKNKESEYTNKPVNLTLLDNVRFIYELNIATLELKSLGVDFEITDEYKDFKILNKSNDIIEKIKKRTAYFKAINNEFTDYFYIIQKNKTLSDNTYLTHWFYPYKGKFHPQMIRALLNIARLEKGDIVLDPFIGSGTTALEAQLLGINFVGFDISPLCVIISLVKTKSTYFLDEIINLKEKIISNVFKEAFDNKNSNFYDYFNNLTSNENVKNFYILGRLIAISDKARRKRDFVKSFVKNIEKMIASVKDFVEVKNQLNLELGNVTIKLGDARQIPLPDNSVDGIITSPPYSIALDYVQNDIHALKELGYDYLQLRENVIGVRGTGKNRLDLYNQDMEKSYKEMYRVLKPQKYAIIVIGNTTYQNKEVKNVEFTINEMVKNGFSLEKNINKIIYGLYNYIQKENILIFKKH